MFVNYSALLKTPLIKRNQRLSFLRIRASLAGSENEKYKIREKYFAVLRRDQQSRLFGAWRMAHYSRRWPLKLLAAPHSTSMRFGLYTALMPSPRLSIDSTVLLVIDVQERLMPTIGDRDRLLNNCAVLLQMAGVLSIPYLVTEQYPAGLGRTVDKVASAMGDPSRRVEKTRFSAAVDVVMDELNVWHRHNILICGIEAHVCVLQTVLDLQDSGWQTFVCSDAISASQPEQIAPAIDRMQKSGAIVTGVLSAMYELLGESTHPAFRSCLELAKSLL